jgi:hypothetical protein
MPPEANSPPFKKMPTPVGRLAIKLGNLMRREGVLRVTSPTPYLA